MGNEYSLTGRHCRNRQLKRNQMRPILFNTEMVRAILDGRKTVTRRVVKPQPKSNIAYACMGSRCGKWVYPGKDAWKYLEDESFRLPDGISQDELKRHWTPPCNTGDILYVRETWTTVPDGSYVYKASVECPDAWAGTWHPSTHMPKEAARLFLRVTAVRVKRLQDITEDGARSEGCYHGPFLDGCDDFMVPALYSFQSVWDSTVRKTNRDTYGWDANPWVWVIEFERIRKEAAMEGGNYGKENS